MSKSKFCICKMIKCNKTEYFNVYEKYGMSKEGEYLAVYEYNKTIKWTTYRGLYDTAKEAAKQLDLKLISLGMEPINTLKRTTNGR